MKVAGPANFFPTKSYMYMYMYMYMYVPWLCSGVFILQAAVPGDNEHSAQGVQTQPTVEFSTQRNQ